MAGKLIGRTDCPWCGHAAHVKESEKCLYVYCPGCGVNGPHMRTPHQRDLLMAKTRPEKHDAEPSATATLELPKTGKAIVTKVQVGEGTPTAVVAEPTPTEPSPKEKADRLEATPTPKASPKKQGGPLFTWGGK